MTAIKLDGEVLAAKVKAGLADRIEALADRGISPGLGTVLVGDDAASHKYVSMKHDEYRPLGVESFDVRLPADATEADVMAVVDQFNADPAVDAYILQYPFPAHLDYGKILLRVDPAKDADGLHPVNLGHLVMGVPAPLACTPAGIQALLVDYDVPIAGQHVVIVGRGLTIGRPLANLLTLKQPGANAAVTVVHTGVADVGRFHPRRRRHPGGGGRHARPHHRRHESEAGRRGHRCRRLVPRRQAPVRCRRRRGRGRRAGCRPRRAASAP